MTSIVYIFFLSHKTNEFKVKAYNVLKMVGKHLVKAYIPLNIASISLCNIFFINNV